MPAVMSSAADHRAALPSAPSLQRRLLRGPERPSTGSAPADELDRSNVVSASRPMITMDCTRLLLPTASASMVRPCAGGLRVLRGMTPAPAAAVYLEVEAIACHAGLREPLR
jgi:hypothetical protein